MEIIHEKNARCIKCEKNTLQKGCPITPCGHYLKSFIASPKGVIKVIENWQLVVPLQDNNRKKFPAGIVKLIRKDVIDAFGGDTEVKTVGSWKLRQRIYTDNSVRVEIDVLAKDHDRAVTYMAEMKRMLKDVLRQERIYVTFSLRFELLLADEFLEDLRIKIPFEVAENPRQEGIDFLVEWSKNPKSKDLTLETEAKLGLTKN